MALRLSRDATRALLSMPKKDAGRSADRLQAIAAAPAGRHPGVEAMQGKPAGRFWVRVDGADVVVDRIGQRGEVYR